MVHAISKQLYLMLLLTFVPFALQSLMFHHLKSQRTLLLLQSTTHFKEKYAVLIAEIFS